VTARTSTLAVSIIGAAAVTAAVVSLPRAAGRGATAHPPAVAVSPAPQRVVSLNLAADEVLVDILAPQRLVGVTTFADEVGTSNVAGRVPPSAVRFPRADVERLVALRPDLVVISQYTDADVQRQLERAGVRLHRMEGLESLDGFRSAVLDLGRAVGEEPAARRLVDRYDAILAEVSRRLVGAPRPRVLYWANPMTAGQGTAIGALIECAGATNVGRQLGITGIVPVGAERAFLADPDVVLIGRWPGARASLSGHPLLSRTRAVRESRIVELPTELLVALNHHAAESCWALAHALHPGRVPAERP
jgi:iron complex transport system substrate-binding protein